MPNHHEPLRRRLGRVTPVGSAPMTVVRSNREIPKTYSGRKPDRYKLAKEKKA